MSKGIRVNGVAPGPIWTPLQIASLRVEEIVGLGSDTTAMKRAGEPIEVAPSYVFLASNLCSSYITGQVLHPNGNTYIYYYIYYTTITTLFLVCLFSLFSFLQVESL